MTRTELLDSYQKHLEKYIHPEALNLICSWILDYNFDLILTGRRRTKLGDYTPPQNGKRHQISVNTSLDQNSFLVTLVHEIAHLTTFNKYGIKAKPHGNEWKQEYQKLMQPFLSGTIFPPEVLTAIKQYLVNPAASSCSDPMLLKALHKHKPGNRRTVLLEDLPIHSVFMIEGRRYFRKGEKIRKRYKCREIKSGNLYLVSGVMEVLPVNELK